MSIEPKTAADKQKLGEALTTLKREDPTFQANYDDETGQTIIAGMGELHLEILRMRLTRDHKVDVIVGKPKVAYKETITKAAEARGKFVKQTGGRGQFGDCTVRVEPFTAEQAKEEELKFDGQLRLREQGVRRLDPEGIHPFDRVRRTHGLQERRARQLPADQRQVHAAGRSLPPGRQLAGGVRAGGQPGFPRRVPRRPG